MIAPAPSENHPHCNILVILGPTASGKTRLGVQLARTFKGEIISADSRQVYRGLDLGAGKDLGEYGEIPYHLIDIVDPGTEFNVFEFQRRFLEAFENIRERGLLPVLVGGSGLYLEAVLNGYRMVEVPENEKLRRELAELSMEKLAERLRSTGQRLHNTTDLIDRARLVRAIEIATHDPHTLPRSLGLHPITFGIHWDRGVLRERITTRLRERMAAGLITEVETLLASGVSHETLDFLGLEYRFIARHLRGELNRNDLFQKLNSAIHDFAKRQETWFRRMERNGTAIHWLSGGDDLLDQALQVLQRMGNINA
ncbi:tRNA (adenosine(37)-N6)-dimethylallyltransferase MiaA [Geobacter sp. DSM 9736]|uniref:tRNA (adenosine(37)-N6)-dimethylallyltransferase MiaA n=1 Tax=Geobacter sp. DSM 9736 TaxID=1277350 RepID=UPI000B4FE29F|nr:tRNA (adenosine(37)-N6)-dimethylallyltransferase MiaA [Geobacter sp. DSM 9736]